MHPYFRRKYRIFLFAKLILAKEKYKSKPSLTTSVVSSESNDELTLMNEENIHFEALNFMNKSASDVFFEEYFKRINKDYNINVNSFNIVCLFSIS